VSERPLLLDLFCCAGGAAEGYHRAGFDVLGVELRGAIPPAYTEHLGEQLLAHLAMQRAA
jgi:hypothetical protein